MLKRLAVLVFVWSALGCAQSVEDSQAAKGDESPLIESGGKEDSFRKPTEIGPIELNQSALATLAPDAGYLTWTFSLYGDAKVTLSTDAPTGSRDEIDTVLYLYKKQSSGSWGSYIARNDDDTKRDSFWSTVSKNLGEGDYRVLVKGYSASDLGEFALLTSCDGSGCNVPFNPGCLFGDTFYDARMAMAASEPRRLKSDDTLTAIEQQQFIAAIRSSGRTEVTDLVGAFASVDQGELNIYTLTEQGGAGRAFVAFEYGLGDNSYGAIFAPTETTLAARIGDGDIYECAVMR
jgi:hypothetical protein